MGGGQDGYPFYIPGSNKRLVSGWNTLCFLLKKFANNNDSFVPAGIAQNEFRVDNTAATFRACYIEKAVA